MAKQLTIDGDEVEHPPRGEWDRHEYVVPEGCVLVPAERIVEHINGYLITETSSDDSEVTIKLEAPLAPTTTLHITHDGYWTAWIET